MNESKSVFDRFGFFTVDGLSEAERQPPEFLVDGMIPVGLSFLSGAPKTRKSFLALQLAAAVASGESFLGQRTKQCSVCYLDLEGSKSRIAYRAERMSIRVPDNVLISNVSTRKLASGLVDDLRTIHRERPEIRLFIIDTYSRARGNVRAGSANAYDADVAFLEPLQRMSIDERIAVLCIHHDRKGAGSATDSFERLSGTMGISGSADSVLNLITDGKRFEGRATLEFTPRDARGGELNLVFDDRRGEWETVASPAVAVEGSPVANWIIHNAPEKRQEGAFYPYDAVFMAAYHSWSDNPGDIVRSEVEQHRDALFRDYGLGCQLGAKSNGRRGLRIINLL